MIFWIVYVRLNVIVIDIFVSSFNIYLVINSLFFVLGIIG